MVHGDLLIHGTFFRKADEIFGVLARFIHLNESSLVVVVDSLDLIHFTQVDRVSNIVLAEKNGSQSGFT